jgi:hypothetical protein
MKRHMGLHITLAVVLVLMTASVAPAQKEGRPPGWRGMSPDAQVAWGEEFREAQKVVEEKIGKMEGLTDTDSKRAMASLANMTAAGVPITEARKLTVGLLDRGFKGAEMLAVSETMSRGVKGGLKPSRILFFIRDRVNEGLRGKELTDAINKAIDSALGL